MIDPKKMIALWNSNEKIKINEFVIVNIEEQNRSHERLLASSGASDEGWMEGRDVDTPLGLYAFLTTYYGFESKQIMFNVLKEFSKVEGQDWAKDILYRARDESMDDA